MKKIRTVELFAGVGGFRLGLEEASNQFEVVWANQWEPSMQDQYAFECYTKHFGFSEKHICADISTVKEQIPEHDLIVGGFPCQDYSIMKKSSQGIEGKKGMLWWQINDILKAKRPSYVLLENVDRILRSPGKQIGRDFSIILRCFYELGYAVEWRVINAADYGCGQRRRRTFIVAYHNSTLRFRNLAEAVCISGLKQMHQYVMHEAILADAFPVATHSSNYTDNWIDEMKYYEMADVSAFQRVFLYNSGVMMNGHIYSVDTIPKYEPFVPLLAILEKNAVDNHFFLRESDMSKWIYAKGAKKESRIRKDGSIYFFTEGAIQFPEPLDKPSRTMLTSESQVGRSSHVVTDYQTGKLRTLTPVECERLNGFPDNWTNTGMPENMRYFCMGNALVVPLIKRIGEALLHSIE